MKYIKIYCGVKYEDKDEAKKLGFKFDSMNKKWFKLFEIEDDHGGLGEFKPFQVEIVDFIPLEKYKKKVSEENNN